LSGEPLPGRGIAAADVARDDGALLVDQRHRGMPEELERPRELGVRIGERRPRPAVLAQKLLGLASIVGDVEADELVRGVTLNEPRVGDRLAVADGSPGGPDIDEDRRPTEVAERDSAAVERRPLELDWGGRGGVRPRTAVSGAATAAAGDERDDRREEDSQPAHAVYRSREELTKS
jgi:hypothetical protein